MQNSIKMRFYLIILVFISFLMSFNSCNIINPPEKIASYLHIDSFKVKGNYDSVGSLSHTITDVWAFVDNEFIGAFELPANIPILKEGTHHIILKAGIKENGISNTRLYYPFYDKFETNKDLKPNVTDTINPTVYYIPNSYKMPVNEDFEDPSFQFTKSDISAINLESTDQKEYVYEGHYSLLAKLTKKGDLFQIESTELYQLPRGRAIFMELNYKSNIILKVGYYPVSSTNTLPAHLVLNLNPTTTWKKVYVNYGGEIDYESTSYFFRLFIGALKATESDTSVVQLDNIKLLYLE
jgi:hypothetical protein